MNLRAIEHLALVHDQDPRPGLYRCVRQASNEPEALQVLNTAVFLQDGSGGQWPLDATQIEFSRRLRSTSQLQRRIRYLSR